MIGVLRSGLGAFGDPLQVCIPYQELPGMPNVRRAGHPGNLRFGRLDGVDVLASGRVHLRGYDAAPWCSGCSFLRLSAAKRRPHERGGRNRPQLEPGDRSS
jgi:hypothetical protein